MLFKNFLLLYYFVGAPYQNLNYWQSLNCFLYFVSLNASDIVAGDEHIFLIMLTYVGLQNSMWMKYGYFTLVGVIKNILLIYLSIV